MLALPLSIQCNNPGNLRPLPSPQLWLGQVGVRVTATGAYCEMDTPIDGVRDLCKNLIAYKLLLGIDTVERAFATWAPASDHDSPGSYAAFVAAFAGVGVTDRIDLASAAFLLPASKAISLMEGGHPPAPDVWWYADAVYQAGVAMALGSSRPLPTVPAVSLHTVAVAPPSGWVAARANDNIADQLNQIPALTGMRAAA